MDTRHFFADYTARKPGDWSWCPTITMGQLTFNGLNALKEKTRVFVEATVGTFDDVFAPGAGADDLEFILIREFDEDEIPGVYPNVEAYYVNTEGYNYARYCVRLDSAIMRELKIEGNY